jgi:WD40 repeat protein
MTSSNFFISTGLVAIAQVYPIAQLNQIQNFRVTHLSQFQAHPTSVSSVSFSPDGENLLTSSLNYSSNGEKL